MLHNLDKGEKTWFDKLYLPLRNSMDLRILYLGRRAMLIKEVRHRFDRMA